MSSYQSWHLRGQTAAWLTLEDLQTVLEEGWDSHKPFPDDDAANRGHHVTTILTKAAPGRLRRTCWAIYSQHWQIKSFKSNGLLFSHLQVNIVTVGTIATEIQLASLDNVLATNATATLLAAEGVYVDSPIQLMLLLLLLFFYYCDYYHLLF